MSDWVIETLRSANPCPGEAPAPPFDTVVRRLRNEPLGDEPTNSRRGPRRLGGVAVALSTVLAVGVAVLAIALLGHGRARSAGPSGGNTGGPLPCRSAVRAAVLPRWARAGFSQPLAPTRYELGAAGLIAAIPFGPLDSPPSKGHNNKILWVSRVPIRYDDLRIEAQLMSGTRRLGAPVKRVVPGGPGPSIINLPSSGCWRLSLRWSGWTDRLDLNYNR